MAKPAKSDAKTRRNTKPRNKRDREARERALATLARMRREGLPLGKAAKAEATTPTNVLRYVGRNLHKDGPGRRYRATRSDRMARTIAMLTPQGEVTITVHSSRDATLAGQHRDAYRKALRGRDASVLEPFKEKAIRAGGVTYAFVTDLEVIKKLARAGLIRGEGLYRAIQ